MAGQVRTILRIENALVLALLVYLYWRSGAALYNAAHTYIVSVSSATPRAERISDVTQHCFARCISLLRNCRADTISRMRSALLNTLLRRKTVIVVLSTLAAVLVWAVAAHASTAPTYACAFGAYRSPGGQYMAVTGPLPGHTAERFTLLSGARGNIPDPGSPARCDNGTFVGRDASGRSFAWKRLKFRETPANFQSRGTMLHGMLLEPVNATKNTPLVVFVHGSERQSPIELYYQLLLTSQGVSTFFYDKRGTGQSHGTYTQDFFALADDAANAAREARKLANGRFGRLGFYGGSQGGWVAPLAAAHVHADFLEVGYGCVGTALEQDQWQVDYELTHLDGFSNDILPDVHRITQKTAQIMGASTPSFDGLAAIKRDFANTPWFSKIDGQYSGDLLHGDPLSVWRENHSVNVPWHYSGLPTLRALQIPQLWVFAKGDSVAPSATSISRLKTLNNGNPVRSLVVFPNTDHGILLYRTAPDGHRINQIDVAEGYLPLLADFAKGRVSGRYGSAEWLTPERSATNAALQGHGRG